MRRLLIVGLLISTVASGFALEVTRGDARLVLHEESARFSFYVRVDGRWEPLFVVDDPRTSGLDILEGNRVHRMGDSGTFDQQTSELPNGARYVWTSPTVRVEQTFEITRGVRSNDYDALQMRVTVTNEGEEPVLIGARLLFDTFLGERSNVHFATPGADRITRETELTPGPVNAYVASLENTDASFGFQFMISDGSITPPERAVVANWKRLADSTWEYEVNSTRNFNRLPYSINDSALLVAYEATQLRTGERYAITSRFGNLSPEGYLAPDAAAAATGADPLLERLAAIVSEINDLIANEEIDAARVAELRSELETLSNQVRGR